MMDNKPLSPQSTEPGSLRDSTVPVGAPTLPSYTPALSTSQPSSLPPVMEHSAAQESFLRNIFIGPDGIYALPKWLLYLAIAWIVFGLERWLLASFQSYLTATWWRLVSEATLMVAAILPAFVMTRVETRKFADFGLPLRCAFGRNFWVGSLWGFASLSLLMLAMRATGIFVFGTLALHGIRIWKFAAYYGLLFLLTGLFEDFLMRGYSQWVLARGFKFWPAAAFLSLTFGYVHYANPGESKTGLMAAGLIGFFLCLTLRRTGDLWWAVGFHMAWDWGESYFYSVPDSGAVLPGHLLNSTLSGPDWLTGGSVGPEGSYLIFVLIGLLWFLFNSIYPDAKHALNVDEAIPGSSGT